jgi:nucleotide-binding universal stress UspA family protein
VLLDRPLCGAQTFSQFVTFISRQEVEIFCCRRLSQCEIGCYRHECVVILRAAVVVVNLAHRGDRDERSDTEHQRGDYRNPYTHPDAHSNKRYVAGSCRAPINSPKATARLGIRCGGLHGVDANGYGGLMPSPILLCTDGSAQSMEALSLGLDLLGHRDELVLITVADGPDPGSLAGSGHAGPDMQPEEYDNAVEQANRSAESVIRQAQDELGLSGAQTRVLQGDPGDPGAAICQLATELSARAIVIGSRGRGGLKRVFLGSVSDHVVRNAPCSVIVTKGDATR